MLIKVCKTCGCIIEYPRVRCSKCDEIYKARVEERKKEYSKRSNAKYNKKRDPKYVRFYNSSEWRILSAKYLQKVQYKCEECKSYASEVHHVVPIQTDEGWNRRLDYTNLKALCLECHNKNHNRFMKRKKR